MLGHLKRLYLKLVSRSTLTATATALDTSSRLQSWGSERISLT
jgi:hypothetical protein